ncbi:MAG: hypothetical protein V4613_04180 [Bacteroidota bacterium]
MKFKHILIVVLAAGLIVASCKKEQPVKPDDQTTTQPVINYEMLRITKPYWTIYKFVLGGIDYWSIPGIIDACNKDNTYRFYKDSVLTTYENDNVCTGSTDSSRTNWKFLNNNKKIEATLLGTTDTADILLLTDSTMDLSIDYNGQPAKIYFKKK